MSAEMMEVDLFVLVEAWRGGCVVIDVREPDEYAAGHVPGARLLPLGELAARHEEIAETDRLHVICASGKRSLQAARWLKDMGYDAVSVAGGTIAWTEAGLPVDR